jgi:hypothetical protein
MTTNLRRHSEGVFIRYDLVKAGDVLLARSGDKFSSAISFGTRGPYSHAAIWLPALPSGAESPILILVESDDLGVGETPLKESN